MPKVSVLMSVYNKSQFLEQSIRSVLDQSFTDFEFIIIDNCSLDNSVAIVKGFEDPRIKFSKNSRNLGATASLNKCIDAVSGEYLVFCHGDDVWDVDFVASTLEIFDQFPNINICHSLMHSIDENGIVTKTQPDSKKAAFEITPWDEALRRLTRGNYVKTPTVFYRSSAMRYYDFKCSYVYDWDMYLQYAVNRNDFLFINKPLLKYRTSSSNETTIGMSGGAFIVECCMVLRNFFAQHQEYSHLRNSAFHRLSNSILRRSRDTATREIACFFLRCAVLIWPWQLLNPEFYFYLIIGVLFGPAGLRLLKSGKKR